MGLSPPDAFGSSGVYTLRCLGGNAPMSSAAVSRAATSACMPSGVCAENLGPNPGGHNTNQSQTQQEEGFIESFAKSGEYKTGHAAKKVGVRFPMVGWATGVAGAP